MKKRELKKNQKRNLIKQTAFKLFEERGYASTRMSDISKLSGIAKGTLYGYYSNKTELFREYLNWLSDAFKNEIADRAESVETVQDAMRKLITSMCNSRYFSINMKVLFETESIGEKAERVAIKSLLRDFIVKQYNFIHERVSESINKHFKLEVDSGHLVTAVIIGAITFYAKIKTNSDYETAHDSDKNSLQECLYESKKWTDDKLFNILMYGINSQDTLLQK